MKGLIKNYIDLLTTEKLNDFGIQNDIHLNQNELEYLLSLIKNNWEDILKDESKYVSEIKKNINSKDADKIINLFKYYKNRYKGYLF